MANDGEHISMCLFSCYVLFGEMLVVVSFAHVLIGFVFLLLNFEFFII
jgi:hypothetical protein